MQHIRTNRSAQLFVWEPISTPITKADFQSVVYREHMENAFDSGFTGATALSCGIRPATPLPCDYTRHQPSPTLPLMYYRKPFTKQTQWSITQNFGRCPTRAVGLMHVAQEGGFGLGGALASD